METLLELRAMLKRLEARWNRGSVGDPDEIVRLDRQMKEIKKKFQACGRCQEKR